MRGLTESDTAPAYSRRFRDRHQRGGDQASAACAGYACRCWRPAPLRAVAGQHGRSAVAELDENTIGCASEFWQSPAKSAKKDYKPLKVNI